MRPYNFVSLIPPLSFSDSRYFRKPVVVSRISTIGKVSNATGSLSLLLQVRVRGLLQSSLDVLQTTATHISSQ